MVVDSKQLDADESAFRDLLRERLGHVEAQLDNIGTRIEELQERRRGLVEQRSHLVALMGDGASPQQAPNRGGADGQGDVSDLSIADRVVALIAERGEPLHYREIERELRARGYVTGGGRDPANTLLSRYFNDPRLFRPRRGTYDLRENNTGARSVGTRKRA